MDTPVLRLFAALILIYLASFSTSQASLIVPVGFHRMSTSAHTIVAGMVRSRHTYWDQGRIYTDITLETMEFLKHPDADRPQEIVVTLLGGEVGDTRMDVSGSPTLFKGQEVVLFLMRHNEKYTVFGLSYGLCHVAIDPATDTQMVYGPVFQTRTFQNIPQTKSISLNPLPPQGEELHSFFKRIRMELNTP